MSKGYMKKDGPRSKDSYFHSPATIEKDGVYSHCKTCGKKIGPFESESPALNALDTHRDKAHLTLRKGTSKEVGLHNTRKILD